MAQINVHLRRELESNPDPNKVFDFILRISDSAFDPATIAGLVIHSRVGPIWTGQGTAATIKALESCAAVSSIQGSQQLHPEDQTA